MLGCDADHRLSIDLLLNSTNSAPHPTQRTTACCMFTLIRVGAEESPRFLASEAVKLANS